MIKNNNLSSYTQPFKPYFPKVQQLQYNSFSNNLQPQQLQNQSNINPISYDVSNKVGQIKLPTSGTGSFTPDVRQYKNEAGNVLFIPFVNNEPLYAIPDGYKSEKEVTKEETAKKLEVNQTPGTQFESDDAKGGDLVDADVTGDRSTKSIADLSLSDISLTQGQFDTALGAQTALNGLDSISFDEEGKLDIGLGFGTRQAIGSLSPIPGTGAIVGIGNAVNRGAALTSLADTLGMSIDSYDAFGAAFSGNTSNIAIDMQNAFTTKQLQNAIQHTALNAMDAMIDSGYTVGTVTDSKGKTTGTFSIDTDGNYSFSTFESFFDANFGGKMNTRSKETNKAERERLGPVANFNEDAYAGKVQSFRDSNTTVTFDQTRQEALDSLGRSQAEREAAEADIASRIDSGKYGPSVSDIRGDDNGGGGFGIGADSSVGSLAGDSEGDYGDFNKGGFLNKKRMSKKKKQPKRKGFAAKQ